MLDALLVKLEKELRAASEASVTQLISTARTQLEKALAEVDKERARGLAEVVEERATAAISMNAKRAELTREIEAMQTHEAQQEGRVELNVGGYRFETSVQTLRRAPGNIFDACFSGRYAQDACTDGSIFIDRDGELFVHVLQYMRDGVLAVVEQNEFPKLGSLRRLKREFGYFAIELYTEQAGAGRQAVLFDTLIAAAACRDGEHEGEAAAVRSDECKDLGADNDEDMVDEDDEESMEVAKRTREDTRRNWARRDAEGEAATYKWCSECLEDKKIDVFRKDVSNKLFGR
jgi:hypothetical protein